MKKKIKFEDCGHYNAWFTAGGNFKVMYCPDCDSLFTKITCPHCNGHGGFYIKEKTLKEIRKLKLEQLNERNF